MTDKQGFSMLDDDEISRQDFDTYQKEVLLSIFNLWQVTRQHEDDLREISDVLKNLNKNINGVWGKLNALPTSPASNKSDKTLLLACISASAINVLVSILLIIMLIKN